MQEATNTAYVRGKANFPHLKGTSLSGDSPHQAVLNGGSGASIAGSTQSLASALYAEKPWRHQKKEKKEKLRKKFLHLDQH